MKTYYENIDCDYIDCNLCNLWIHRLWLLAPPVIIGVLQKEKFRGKNNVLRKNHLHWKFWKRLAHLNYCCVHCLYGIYMSIMFNLYQDKIFILLLHCKASMAELNNFKTLILKINCMLKIWIPEGGLRLKLIFANEMRRFCAKLLLIGHFIMLLKTFRSNAVMY